MAVIGPFAGGGGCFIKSCISIRTLGERERRSAGSPTDLHTFMCNPGVRGVGDAPAGSALGVLDDRSVMQNAEWCRGREARAFPGALD